MFQAISASQWNDGKLFKDEFGDWLTRVNKLFDLPSNGLWYFSSGASHKPIFIAPDIN